MLPTLRHRVHFAVLKTHDDEGSFLGRVIPNMFQHIARINTGGKDSMAILEQMTEFSIRIFEQFRNDRDNYPENSLYVFDTRRLIDSFRFLCANYKVFDVQFLQAWTFEISSRITDQLMDLESLHSIKDMLVDDFGVPDVIRCQMDLDNRDNCNLGMLKKDSAGDRTNISILSTITETMNEASFSSGINKKDLDVSIIEPAFQLHYHLCVPSAKVLLTQLDCSKHRKIVQLACSLSNGELMEVPYGDPAQGSVSGVSQYLEDKIVQILGKVIKQNQEITVFIPENWIDDVNDHVFINSLLNGISVKELFPKANLEDMLEEIKFRAAQKNTTNIISNEMLPVVNIRLVEEELSSIFRDKVHFVFSFSGIHSASQYVIEKLPAVKRHCQTLRVKVPLHRRCHNLLQRMQAIPELTESHRDVMIFLEGLAREMASITRFPLQHMQSSLAEGNLDDIIVYFEMQRKTLAVELEEYEKGISIVCDCEEQIMGLKKKIVGLSSKILEVGSQAGELLKLIDSSQELARDSKLMLDRIESQIQKTLEEYNQCKTIYQKDLSVRTGAISDIIREISILDPNDVMDLYYSRNGGRPVQTLVNFLNIVFSSNGNTVNIGQALTSSAIPFNQANFTPAKLANFKPEYFMKLVGAPDMNQMSFITIVLEQTNLNVAEIKTFKLLRDLIVSLYQYRSAMISELQQKYEQMVNQEKVLMKMNESLNEEKRRWQEFQTKSSMLTKELDQKLREKGLLEHDLKKSETTYEESISNVDKLVFLTKRWKTHCETIRKKQKLCIGNSIYSNIAQVKFANQ